MCFQYKADLIRSFETNILPAFDSKALKPVIDRSFELEDIGKAHALMESNLNAGKILLKVIPTTKEELWLACVYQRDSGNSFIIALERGGGGVVVHIINWFCVQDV